jgi:hypothetical protein
MKNRLSIGDYEIAYSSVHYETCFRAHVSVRLRSRYEPERVAKYVYFTAHDSAKAALAEARRQAEYVGARPALHLS